MKHKFLFFPIFLYPFLVFCRAADIEINPAVSYQEIDYFTASDAWSGNFAGMYWNADEKEKIARWLFSSKTDASGNPEGIGLSLWRVNAGAGTLEQDNADIVPYQRRAESFRTKDNRNYDWGKCSGQQFFMQKAIEYGCNNFILFSNSPIVQYTKNGRGWSSRGDSANIRPEHYAGFAAYLADVAGYYLERGWNIFAVSPINEPQINWDSPRQEGSPWRNPEIKKMFEELDNALTQKGMDNVKMLLGETADLRQLYEESPGLRKQFGGGDETPDKQIEAFFDPNSPYYIGSLKHLPKLIAGHSYHTHSTNRQLRETREKLSSCTKKYGIDFIQSEWCMLPGIKDPVDGFQPGWSRGNFANMDVTLQLGRLIYGDIVYAGAKAWAYWKGMEVNGAHALITLSLKDGNILNGGFASTGKLLWGLGNYSFFIRPGYVRIKLTGADDLDTLAGSAYQSPDRSRIVAVYVNSSHDECIIKTSFPGKTSKKIKSISAYTTNSSMDLAKTAVNSNLNGTINIPARSIVTAVYDFEYHIR
jgi:O-glycosyl hydrolase